MLHPGLYEQVINNALTSELAEIPDAEKRMMQMFYVTVWGKTVED